MTRYLLPFALISLLAFAAPEARAENHHHHHRQGVGMGMGMSGVGIPGAGLTAGRFGYGYSSYGAGLGLGYGGYAPVFAPYPAYGAFGYPVFAAPLNSGAGQSYFSNPNYGRWGAFGN